MKKIFLSGWIACSLLLFPLMGADVTSGNTVVAGSRLKPIIPAQVLPAETIAAKAELAKYLEQSAINSFRAEIEAPIVPGKTYTMAKWTRVGNAERDAVECKLELYQQERLDVVYLQNGDGQFGIADDFVCRIGDIIVLFQWEKLFEPWTTQVNDYFYCTKEEFQMHGKSYLQYRLDYSRPEEPWLLEPRGRDRTRTLFTRYPVTQIYTVDPELSQVIGLKYYNKQGQVLLDLKLKSVSLLSYGEKIDVSLPLQPVASVRYRSDFERERATRAEQTFQKKVVASHSALSGYFVKFWRWLTQTSTIIGVGGVAVACLALAIILTRWRSKHR